MKNTAQQFVATMGLLIVSVLSAQSAWATQGNSFWCGTSDRELEVKTYADHLDVLNPDAANGPVVTDKVSMSALMVNTTGFYFRGQSESQALDLFVSPNVLEGTDIYPGTITLTDADGQISRSAMTCVTF